MIHHSCWRCALGLFVLIAAGFAAPRACLARIGETKAECLKRYGAAINESVDEATGRVEVVWDQSGVEVTAWFADESSPCHTVSFKKADGSGLEENERESYLADNAGGSEWILTCNSGDTTTWLTRDFKRTAAYSKTEAKLTIELD